MPSSRVFKNLEIQCPLEGLVGIPKQQTPQGCPETDVFVRQEMPRRMNPFKLIESGPEKVTESERSHSSNEKTSECNYLSWFGAFAGDAVLPCSENGQWYGSSFGSFKRDSSLWFKKIRDCLTLKRVKYGKVKFKCNPTRALMCVVILVLDGSEFFFFLKRSEAWR